jgi:hypothetical protein
MLGCKQACWSECTTGAASLMQRAGRVRQRRIACCGDVRLSGAGREKRGRAGALLEVQRRGGESAKPRMWMVEEETARSCSLGRPPLQWKPTRNTSARTRKRLKLGQAGYHLRLGTSRHRLQQRHGPPIPCTLTTKRNLVGTKGMVRSMVIWYAQPLNRDAASSRVSARIHRPIRRRTVPVGFTKRRQVEPLRLGFPLTGLRSADAPPILDRSSRDSRGTLTHPCTQEGNGWRQSPWAGETVPTKSGNCLQARGGAPTATFGEQTCSVQRLLEPPTVVVVVQSARPAVLFSWPQAMLATAQV